MVSQGAVLIVVCEIGCVVRRRCRPLGLVTLILFMTVASPARASDGVEGVWRWRIFIAEASGRFGIPIRWIERVMQVESAGKTVRNGAPIRSHAGAMGLMQLMPATWADMRAAYGLGSDPDDPRDNILAGTAYLRAMYDRFGYPGLFGAYNAGPARYAAHLAGRTPLPDETIAYLSRVTGSAFDGTPGLGSISVTPVSQSTIDRLFAVRDRSAEPPRVSSSSGQTAESRRDGSLFAIDRHAR